jgi:hypothetical protein
MESLTGLLLHRDGWDEANLGMRLCEPGRCIVDHFGLDGWTRLGH